MSDEFLDTLYSVRRDTVGRHFSEFVCATANLILVDTMVSLSISQHPKVFGLETCRCRFVLDNTQQHDRDILQGQPNVAKR